MLNINIKPLARQDLLGIWQYSNETWGNKQADLYLQELDPLSKSCPTHQKLAELLMKLEEG